MSKKRVKAKNTALGRKRRPGRASIPKHLQAEIARVKGNNAELGQQISHVTELIEAERGRSQGERNERRIRGWEQHRERLEGLHSLNKRHLQLIGQSIGGRVEAKRARGESESHRRMWESTYKLFQDRSAQWIALNRQAAEEGNVSKAALKKAQADLAKSNQALLDMGSQRSDMAGLVGSLRRGGEIVRGDLAAERANLAAARVEATRMIKDREALAIDLKKRMGRGDEEAGKAVAEARQEAAKARRDAEGLRKQIASKDTEITTLLSKGSPGDQKRIAELRAEKGTLAERAVRLTGLSIELRRDIAMEAQRAQRESQRADTADRRVAKLESERVGRRETIEGLKNGRDIVMEDAKKARGKVVELEERIAQMGDERTAEKLRLGEQARQFAEDADRSEAEARDLGARLNEAEGRARAADQTMRKERDARVESEARELEQRQRTSQAKQERDSALREAEALRGRVAVTADPEEIGRIVERVLHERLGRMEGASRGDREATVQSIIQNINQMVGRELVRVGEDGGITVDAEAAQAQAAEAQAARPGEAVDAEIKRRRALLQDIENDINLTPRQKRRAKAKLLEAEREAGAMARGAEGLGKMSWAFTGMAGNIVLVIVLALVAWIILNIFPMI